MAASPFDSVHADPWAQDFVDLPTLNARASEAVERSIQKVRAAAAGARGSALPTPSLVLLGTAGSGKTHLFTRLRHQLGPRAVFVHLRPLLGSDLSLRQVLQAIVEALHKRSHGEGDAPFTQLDALVGAALACARGESPRWPQVVLEDLRRLRPPPREEALAQCAQRLLERWEEDVDEPYLVQLLRTPFADAPTRRALLGWLGGRELDDIYLRRLGVARSLEEGQVLPALRTLSRVAALGAPLVLVFDQLENLVDADDVTGGRVRAWGNLVAELVDSVGGLVLVHMALDSEWSRALESGLSLPQRSRVAQEREVLALPTPAQCEQLLHLWVERLPGREAPFPSPFTRAQVERWCHAPGTTPRMLLLAGRHALEGAPEPEEAPSAGGTAGAPTPRPTLRTAPLPAAPRIPAVAPVAVAAPAAAPVERPGAVRPSRAAAPVVPVPPTGAHAEPPGTAPPAPHAPPGSAPRGPAPYAAPPPSAATDALPQQWDERLAAARAFLDAADGQRQPVDAARLVEGLVAAGQLQPGARLQRTSGRQPFPLLSMAGGQELAIALVLSGHALTVHGQLHRLAALAATRPVLGLRERRQDFPPTWRKVREAHAAFVAAPHARWVLMERDDVVRLLALGDFVAAARSRDLEDPAGRPLEEGVALGWARSSLGLDSWPLLRALSGTRLETEEAPAAAAAPGTSAAALRVPGASATGTAAPAGDVLAHLRRLRVASLDRLVREVGRGSATASRSAVVEALEAAGPRVRFFGRSIVTFVEGA